MTTMTDVSAIANNSTSSLAPPTTLAGKQLTQADFLQLLTQQLQNQDPTQPMDPTEFVSQMAQFSQLTAAQGMQTSLNQLATSLQANQMLGASSLIGHQILVPSSQISITGSGTAGATGAVDVPGGASDVQVKIADSSGKTVRTLDLGAQPAGYAQFQWDGMDASGQPVPPGTYNVSASNASVSFTTYAGGQVQGVNSAGGTVNVQVGGIGNVPLSQVTQIL